MAGTVGGLPYPTGTDRVVEGDNAIRALAEAVDKNVSATTPSVMPLGTGWVSPAPYQLRGWRVNGWLFISGRVQRQSGQSGTIIAQPSAFWKPAADLLIPAISYVTSNTSPLDCVVTMDMADGYLRFAPVSATPPQNIFVVINFSYPRGTGT